LCKATYFEHDQRFTFSANSESILYEPRKSRKFRRCESLTTSIDDNDLDSYRLIASLQETQLEIRDRGAEKWWAKKWKIWGLMALFFCPQFFCHCKCTTDISVDVKMQFNANAFQGDHNVVEYWIPDARTPKITWLPSRDFDSRKRPIGNSGGFFCSAVFLSPEW
jgi:hypothetical protein